MRLALLASTILGLAVCGEASAQERTPDAAMVDAAIWTGFHVGAQLGLVAPDSDFDVDFVGGGDFFSENIDDLTIIGGLYVGYTQQFGHFILGAEGDISGMPLDHGNEDVFFDGKTSFDYSSHWLSTVRGRAGVTYADVALYGTGGLAFGEVEASLSDSSLGFTESDSTSDIEVGWTVGGGVALALDERWQAKAEYLFVDLDDTNLSLPILGEAASVDNIFHLGRLGLARKF